MTARPETETVAIARAAYEGLQDQLLAATPLAGMADWVRTGAPPAAAELRDQGLRTGSGLDLALAQKAFVRQWGYAIPCAEAVEALRGLGPLVEIGAGAGAWAALLTAAGLDVVATDIQVQGKLGYGFTAASRARVEPLSAPDAVRAYPDRDVFCCWPTRAHPWALAAVRAMRPGRRLALIAAPRGGVTGTPGLYRYLETRFELLETIEIPQFPQAHDRLTIHRRVR
jgi:uncharacterized UPF0146 family protein